MYPINNSHAVFITMPKDILFSSNICRYCHSIGSKDLFTEYFDSGQEVYGDIIKEIFNIEFPIFRSCCKLHVHDSLNYLFVYRYLYIEDWIKITIDQSDCGSGNEHIKQTKIDMIFNNDNTIQCSRLICSSCIQKLLEAFKFRNMVVTNEKKIMEYFQNLQNNENENIKLDGTIIKSEKTINEDGKYNIKECGEYDTGGYGEHDIQQDWEDDVQEASIIEEQELLVPRYPTGNKRIIEIDSKKSKRLKVDKNNVSDKRNRTEKDWKKISERRGPAPLLRENSLKLLENSTMFLFQWNKSRYTCYICKEYFLEISTLGQHFNTHTIQDIEKKMIRTQNKLLKVEISSLNCKKCRKKLQNINELTDHLVLKHKIKFQDTENKQNTLLIPFKIKSEGLKCQTCGEKFDLFRLLNMHVNKHYQNQVCDICGTSSPNLATLNLHKTRAHKVFKCVECNLDFTTRSDKNRHDAYKHNVKVERKLRFLCQFCDERFFQENLKIQHLVDKHGLQKPDYKCSFCNKTFLTRSLCNNHTKNVHRKERKHECEFCHEFFYTKSDVTRHKVTHTGEKKFLCSQCNSLFASKDSLRRHSKRTHGFSK